MGLLLIRLSPMEFASRLAKFRKSRGLTQQSLADNINLHVNQIKRYEAGTAQPTLETLVRLAKELHSSIDDLVFSDDERGPSNDFKMQFEALDSFDDEERKIAKALLESLILKHNAKRAFTDQL